MPNLLILCFADFDEFFDADGIQLIALPLKPGFLNEFFTEQAVAAFGQNNQIGGDGFAGQIIGLLDGLLYRVPGQRV